MKQKSAGEAGRNFPATHPNGCFITFLAAFITIGESCGALCRLSYIDNEENQTDRKRRRERDGAKPGG